MDLRLREVTWLRLLTLLAWTILVMFKRGVSQLIEIIEERFFERGVQAPAKEVRDKGREKSTLLQPLSDEIVLDQIWPLLHQRVNVSLLWRLRRVSRAWKESVARSLEWSALEIVRIDTPGFVRYLEQHCERRPSLRERVEDELKSISELLKEHLSDFVVQSECLHPWPADFGESDEEWSTSSSSARFHCACEMKGVLCSIDRGQSRECSCSERESVNIEETCESSSDSTMTVNFPRHQIRIKN